VIGIDFQTSLEAVLSGRNTLNFDVYILLYLKDEMGGACSTNGGEEERV
jgi:hypothetical protein